MLGGGVILLVVSFAGERLFAGNIGEFLFLVASLVVVVAVTVLSPHVFPDICIYEEGLEVQGLLFGWHFVPWEDVLEWQPIVLSSLWRRTSIILVRRLTPVHFLFGWMYAFSDKPGFLVGSHISDYNGLRQFILGKMREFDGGE